MVEFSTSSLLRSQKGQTLISVKWIWEVNYWYRKK